MTTEEFQGISSWLKGVQRAHTVSEIYAHISTPDEEDIRVLDLASIEFHPTFMSCEDAEEDSIYVIPASAIIFISM